MKVGIIGCGNIADIYFSNSQKYFNNFEIVACADIKNEAAKNYAEKYGVEHLSVDQILSNKEIELRFKSFNEDIKHWNDYDYIVINKNLDICFKQIEEIIKNNKKDSSNFYQKSQ